MRQVSQTSPRLKPNVRERLRVRHLATWPLRHWVQAYKPTPQQPVTPLLGIRPSTHPCSWRVALVPRSPCLYHRIVGTPQFGSDRRLVPFLIAFGHKGETESTIELAFVCLKGRTVLCEIVPSCALSGQYVFLTWSAVQKLISQLAGWRCAGANQTDPLGAVTSVPY